MCTFSFTNPTHYAHPAMIKRCLIIEGNDIYFAMKGHYAGNQEKYDRWWNDWKSLNDSDIKNIKSKLESETKK